jgi:hypothetical protein
MVAELNDSEREMFTIADGIDSVSFAIDAADGA